MRWRRRARAVGQQTDQVQRMEGQLLRVFGPPQLGDPNEAPPPPVAADPRCPFCGQPDSAHSFVRTAERRLVRCPDPVETAAS